MTTPRPHHVEVYLPSGSLIMGRALILCDAEGSPLLPTSPCQIRLDGGSAEPDSTTSILRCEALVVSPIELRPDEVAHLPTITP